MTLKVNIDNLTLSKNGTTKKILRNIDFELCPGNIYSIFGLNGSGKTTLLKSIIGSLDKRFYSLNGNIYLGGTDVSELNAAELRKFRKYNIRFVFQDAITSFDPLKKVDYYFNEIRKDDTEINKLLEYFKMPDYAKIRTLFPYELSGGMAQRLSIILALLSGVKLILFDEPTSALDVSISNLLKLKLKELSQYKKTIFLIVTQDLKFGLRTADYAATLKNGVLTDFEPVENYSSDNNLLIKLRY